MMQSDEVDVEPSATAVKAPMRQNSRTIMAIVIAFILLMVALGIWYMM